MIRWVVSEEVYQGELSTKALHDLRERYIGEKHLAGLAKDFSLDEALILPKGQEKMGGRSNLGTLHTVFEAVVGAIYRDQGYEIARDFVMNSIFKK